MEKKNFKNYDELAAFMVEHKKEQEFVTAIVFYDDARMLLRSLFEFPGVEAGFIELESPEYGGYNQEYFVSLDSDDLIWVEKAYKYDRYLDCGAYMILIDSDASSRLCMSDSGAIYYEISIGEETDDSKDETKNNCECKKDDDGTITIKIHPTDVNVPNWFRYDPFWHDPFFRMRFPMLF